MLRKSGLAGREIVKICCSLVRSILEYASPVWTNIPDYLSNLVEAVQKEALRNIFPNVAYDDPIVFSKLQLLSERREQACRCFMQIFHTDVSYRRYKLRGSRLISFPSSQMPAMAKIFGLAELVTVPICLRFCVVLITSPSYLRATNIIVVVVVVVVVIIIIIVIKSVIIFVTFCR